MSRGKGFAEKKLLIRSNFSRKSHPLKKLAREGSTDYRALIRFIEEHWERLSAQAWKGYLEQGRGAIAIKLDKMVLLGGNFSVQYIDEREIFRREMMRGLWAAMQSYKVQKILNEYNPERQVAIIFEWRGRDGHISLPYNLASSTPPENYEKLGFQAEEPTSPLNKLLNLRAGAEIEWTDPSNPPHPIARLLIEDLELFGAFAWKGYLEEGRGAVHILLGKGGWEAQGIPSWNSGQFPFKYLGERRSALFQYLKQTKNGKELQELISKYDPRQEIVFVFGWTCCRGVIFFSLKITDRPPECYKHLKGQLDEFTLRQPRQTFLIAEEKTKSIFDELAEYRQGIGLPPAGSQADKSTIAKLEVSGQSFFGINSGSNPNPRQITLRVNPITKTHAEADAFQQAADAGVKGGKARLIVDRDLCDACGLRGGVNSMAWQLGIEELEIITPSESKTITVKPPNTRRQ